MRDASEGGIRGCNNLRRIREGLGLTREKVIAELGKRGVHLSCSQFALVENTCGRVSMKTIFALADVYGCDFNAIFQENTG